jgi:A/G-specific adenine glycosylase
MLQQTTVAAVIPYFQRFIQTYPTVRHLAQADEQEVLHLWQGLGYYRRARHLHQAARIIVNEWDGHLPDDPNRWMQLPGVGRYILGAVLSQAFDRRLPIIEANSIRVLSRWFGRRGDPKTTVMQKWLWTAAADILPRKRIGDFNQAMMELGALICTPTDPHCEHCPIRRGCAALADGSPTKFPLSAQSKRTTPIEEVAVVVRHGNKLLLAQRPTNAQRWASMWEFPQTALHEVESHEEAAKRWLKQSLGVTARLGPEIVSVRYAVTRFRMTMTVLEARLGKTAARPIRYAAVRWVTPAELKNYPMSTAQRRVAETVSALARQRRLF